jgi:hypothetical protein
MTSGRRGHRESNEQNCSLSSEEFAGGGVDEGALGDGQRAEQRGNGAGIGDTAEGDGGVEDAHGVDFVVQILKGLEDAAETWCLSEARTVGRNSRSRFQKSLQPCHTEAQTGFFVTHGSSNPTPFAGNRHVLHGMRCIYQQTHLAWCILSRF